MAAVRCALEVVLFLQLLVFLLHDLVPLGRWNNLAVIGRAVPLRRRIFGAMVNSALGLLALFLFHLKAMHHDPMAMTWLIVLQAILLLGEVRWWWYPYFAGASPELVARLRPNWENTIAFLPERNGIRPNALHCVMHGLTLAGLVLAIAAR